MRLDGREDVTEPVREPEDEVVLELVDSGESGVIVAANCKEKNQLNLNVCSLTDFYWQ